MTPPTVKPIVVLGDLKGPEGNVFVILGRCQRALEQAGIDPAEFMTEAHAGRYDHVIDTVDRWFTVVERQETLEPTTALDMLERSRGER